MRARLPHASVGRGIHEDDCNEKSACGNRSLRTGCRCGRIFVCIGPDRPRSANGRACWEDSGGTIGAGHAEYGSDSRVRRNQVVKTTCFLDDMDDFAAFNKVYARSFEDYLPARSAVAVERLPKGALVEVEFIAKVGE